MPQYEPAGIDINPMKLRSWERVLKFYLVAFAVMIVTVIILIALVFVVELPPMISGAIGFLVSIMSIMAMTSLYEGWIGCHFPVAE